jgi:Spy/CpxP family protein refolding chaperone
MNKKWITAGGITLALVIALGVTWASRRSQANADQSSLSAQLGSNKNFGPGGQGGPGGPGGGPMADMAKQLGLSESQQKQMQAEQERMMKRMGGMGKSGPPSNRDMQADMEEERKRMDAILTPEQREKMKQMMAKMPMPGSMGMNQGGGPR